MENNIVFTDEMDETRLGVFPPTFPIAELFGLLTAQFYRIGDIAYRSVEPYVQHFTFGIGERYGYAPVEVAADGTGLQAHVEPTFTLTVNVCFPFLVIVKYIIAKPSLVFIEWQVPMACLTHNGFRARYSRLGIYQIGRTERRPARLALVAVCTLVAAVRALTHDITVCQKLPRLFVVILLGCLFDKLAFVV